jgi:hypothetical protein
VLSSINPKNFFLIIAATAAIAQAGLPAGGQAVTLAVFTAIASLGAAAPIVIHFALGDRGRPLLARLQTWMTRNNAVILAVILLAIGAKVIGDAIGGLTG